MVKDNNIDMYSTHNNERKSVRALKSKIYKYMTSISKNGYIDKLEDNGVCIYNNRYHSTIKMKPTNVVY